MCGIAGYWHFRPQAGAAPMVALAADMVAALAHRGPDGTDSWADAESGMAMAHRRLAIIDCTPAGAQPMHSADGRWVLVLNGEVYNHREIRRDLAALGVAFRGASDTEMLLEACAQWGLRGALARCEGMFAFALWDRRERRLSLVRDMAGIKPLYWAMPGGTLLFGSELKALRRHPAFIAQPDPSALAGFLRFGYVPGPATAYAGVHKLMPGMVLTVAADGSTQAEPYAEMTALLAPADPAPPLTDSQALDQLDHLLAEAVAQQMAADVPAGVFLSGGIDSSLVAALAQAGSARQVPSFAIGFDEAEYDEAPHAAAVARHLGTAHTELRVDAAAACAVVPRLAEMYDEPFADASQIPTALLCALARGQVGVALSGDGGDELFGGYSRYQHALRLAGLAGRIPSPLRQALAAALRRLPAPSSSHSAGRLRRLATRLHKGCAMLGEGGEDALYLALMSLWPAEDCPLPGATEYPGPFTRPGLGQRVPEYLRRMQCLDAMTYLPDDILVKVDRASMAVGLEVRVPLLDSRVVALAGRLSLPQRLRGSTGKWALREVLYRHVPRALVDRPKMGFGAPTGAWLRGPLRDWAEDLLSVRSLEAESGLDPRRIRLTWQQHLEGSANWQYRLWPVLMLVAWRRHWL